MVGLYQLEVGMSRALRAAFTHHHQFRWNPDPQLTKIAVYDGWPLVLRSFPNIIVSANGGNLLKGFRGIGDEYADQDTTPISVNGLSYAQVNSEIRSGNNKVTVTLVCEARTRSEVLQIADWTALFVRSFAPEKFAREGLYVDDMTASPVSGRLEGADPVYSVALTLTCLTEFSRTIPISVSSTLNALCLVGVFTSLPDGSTYGETYS